MSLRIAGRSSSHFTRVVRIFAHELGVEYAFQPVMDLLSQNSDDYLGNPALRLPVLESRGEAWYGALNICRELARRASPPRAIVWPDLPDREVANAQELVLQGMSTEVSIVMHKLASPDQTDRYEDKNRRSLQNSLAWLEAKFPSVRARLPADRTISFLEVSAYCFLTHLEFRRLIDTTGYAQLSAFVREFDARPSARDTTYRFDPA